MANIFGALPIIFVAMSLFSRVAMAQLTVCNRSPERVSVAVAYNDGERMVSRGWYQAAASECVVVVSGDLARRYYYIRATSASGRTWGDNYSFCTRRQAYEVPARDDCAAHGYDKDTFFEVDTGNRLSYTQGLVLRNDSRTSDAVDGIRYTWRASILDPETRVLQMWSSYDYATTVRLRCYAASGWSKSFTMTVPANGVAELGVLEGWPNGFTSGERCETTSGSSTVTVARLR